MQAGPTLLIVCTSIVCNSPTQSHSNSVTPDRNVAADVFGNHDGADELSDLDSYFAANSEAWCVSGLRSWYSNEVSAGEIISCIAGSATRPYPSERALRHDYEGVNIRRPFVSIAVLNAESQIIVTKFFRSPGPRISSADWEVLEVK